MHACLDTLMVLYDYDGQPVAMYQVVYDVILHHSCTCALTDLQNYFDPHA